MEQVAGWLYEVARLVFARGDFLKDRNTIDRVGGTWRCHHAVSGVEPSRNVVDFQIDETAAAFVTAPTRGIQCPACGWLPDTSSRWECDCGFMWNTFDTRALCPACEKHHLVTACPRCHESTAHERWYDGPPAR
jgi:hypothetical protein